MRKLLFLVSQPFGKLYYPLLTGKTGRGRRRRPKESRRRVRVPDRVPQRGTGWEITTTRKPAAAARHARRMLPAGAGVRLGAPSAHFPAVTYSPVPPTATVPSALEECGSLLILPQVDRLLRFFVEPSDGLAQALHVSVAAADAG